MNQTEPEASNQSSATALEIDVNSETESTAAQSVHSTGSHTTTESAPTPRGPGRPRSLRSRGYNLSLLYSFVA